MRNRIKVVKKYKLTPARTVRARDVISNLLTTVKTTARHTWKLLRDQIPRVLITIKN